jgi:hypothetical protein
MRTRHSQFSIRNTHADSRQALNRPDYSVKISRAGEKRAAPNLVFERAFERQGFKALFTFV